VNTTLKASAYRLWMPICSMVLLGLSAPSSAQTKLSLQNAINRALESRASLKGEAAQN